MARDDWAALVTDPVQEYLAHGELLRLGLRVYLPQIRKRWTSPYTKIFRARLYPLFPRYVLIEIRDLDYAAIRTCRGVRRHNPALADAAGHPWRASAKVIDAVREAENAGTFDETLSAGDAVHLTNGALAGIKAVMTNPVHHSRAEILLPLFGGVKATAPMANVARAS